MILPPGLAMLCATPNATGSSVVMITIGIVRITAWVACAVALIS